MKRLSVRLRKAAPPAVRNLFRVFRSFTPIERSKPIPAELLSNCRFCPSRIEMLDFLPRGGVVAELGTHKGDFAKQILKRNEPSKLHLIDIDYSAFDESILRDSRVSRHQGLSNEVIATFPDEYFDWIYVDAGHSYDEVIKDAYACAPKVKPGGLMAFNDFAHIDLQLGRYGVHRAVVDFARDLRWPFHFFAFQDGALYDVALYKPPRD